MLQDQRTLLILNYNWNPVSDFVVSVYSLIPVKKGGETHRNTI